MPLARQVSEQVKTPSTGKAIGTHRTRKLEVRNALAILSRFPRISKVDPFRGTMPGLSPISPKNAVVDLKSFLRGGDLFLEPLGVGRVAGCRSNARDVLRPK